MRFVDTNVFIRYLTKDDPEKAEACRRLLEAAEVGEEQVFVCESILAEIAYVLRGVYHVPQEEIADDLKTLVRMSGLRIPRRPIIGRALDLFGENSFLDFEDALALAYMEAEGINEILSYDKGFDRITGVVRVEPS